MQLQARAGLGRSRRRLAGCPQGRAAAWASERYCTYVLSVQSVLVSEIPRNVQGFVVPWVGSLQRRRQRRRPQAKHEWTEGMRHLAENELFVLSAFIAFQ